MSDDATEMSTSKPLWPSRMQRGQGPAPTTPPPPRKKVTGAELIAAERERQITTEGWTPKHDASHDSLELLEAAITYIAAAEHAEMFDHAPSSRAERFNDGSWPWEPEAWKPSDDPIRNLVKAGALIAAEIDRLARRNPGVIPQKHPESSPAPAPRGMEGQ